LAATVNLFYRKTGEMIVPRFKEMERVAEEDENMFNKMDVNNNGFWKSSTEDKVKFEERKKENKEIVRAFKDTNGGFKVVSNRIDGMALMMTTEITTNRQELKDMKEKLKDYQLENERSQRAWKVMEESLGRKIEESNDNVDKLLRNYESFEEKMARQDRDWNMIQEMGFLGRLDAAAQYWEGVKRGNKQKEENDKIREEKQKKYDEEFKKEMEWYQSNFAADFKKIGYRWLPVFCVQRPVALALRQYDHYLEKEEVDKRELGIAVSALSTYFLITVLLSAKLVGYLWNKFWLVIEKEIDSKVNSGREMSHELAPERF